MYLIRPKQTARLFFNHALNNLSIYVRERAQEATAFKFPSIILIHLKKPFEEKFP